MHKGIKKSLAVVSAVSLGVLFSAGGAAQAQDDDWDGWSGWWADLEPLNNQEGSGEAMVEFANDDNEATITITYDGLAEDFDGDPYPHAQHIHIGANGECPDESADEDGDGVVSTTEGHDAYGEIGTSLTTEGDTSPDSGLDIDRYPGGPSAEYERVIELDDAVTEEILDENAVIVVHGLDPELVSEEAQEAESDLDPELPLVATSPALCGPLVSAQMEDMPEGAPDTGGGFIADTNSGTMFGAAGTAAVVAALAIGMAVRNRTTESVE